MTMKRGKVRMRRSKEEEGKGRGGGGEEGDGGLEEEESYWPCGAMGHPRMRLGFQSLCHRGAALKPVREA